MRRVRSQFPGSIPRPSLVVRGKALRLALLVGVVGSMLALAGQASAAVVTVNLAGTGTGSVTSVPAGINCSNTGGPPGPTCSFNFPINAGVKLTATPNSPSILRSWTGNATNSNCNQGFANPCFMTSLFLPMLVTADFGPQPDPAIVGTGGSSLVGSYSARLAGTVNPNGFLVSDCRFEYGKTTDYGRSVPCSPTSIGSGSSDVAVRGFPAFLDPASTYHYRVVATTVGGAGAGGDQTFTTAPAPDDDCPNAAIRAQQRVDYPYCMALEMVSPPAKENAKTGFTSIGADGDVVRFFSLAALADTPSLSTPLKGDSYVAERTGAGWETVPTVTPALYSVYSKGNPQMFSADMRRWFTLSFTKEQYTVGALTQFDGDILGNWSIRPPELMPVASEFSGSGSDEQAAIDVQVTTASPDLSRVFFRPARSARYFPGDPVSTETGDDDWLTYVSIRRPDGSGALELLTRDESGHVWGGNCDNYVGGGDGVGGGSLPRVQQGSVSSDGRRVYFTVRPSQPFSGECDTAANKLRIMRRLETPGGPQISQMISTECDRVTPACDSTDGDDLFQGASVDGTKIYFTTSRQLADSDLDTGTECSNTLASSAGCDLYLFDSTRPAGQRLTQVSAGDGTDATPGADASVARSIAAVSGDGSRAYFVSPDVLTADQNPVGQSAASGEPNLYAFHRDSEGSDGLSFVATLAAGDGAVAGLFGSELQTMRNAGAAVPLVGEDPEVGGDGHILVFRSAAQVTADDSDGTRRDVFRYDSQADTLERISKAGPDGEDNGAHDVDNSAAALGTLGPDMFETVRWVSEDGRTVVFASSEGLVDGNANARVTVYLWRDGDLIALPGDASANVQSNGFRQIDSPTLSRSGDEVVFASSGRLLPEDGDISRDVYVARVDGGFPFREPVQECDSLAGGCQGSGASTVDAGRTTDGAGAGNAEPGERARLTVAGLSRGQRTALARGQRVRLRVRSSASGRVSIRGTARVGGRSRVVFSVRKRLSASRTTGVSVRLSNQAQRQLARTGRLQLRLSVAFPNARQQTTSVPLRRTASISRGGSR